MSKDIQIEILEKLRQDSRQSFRKIAKQMKIPYTTVFDNGQKALSFVTRFTTLLDFPELGYGFRMNFRVIARTKKALDFVSEHFHTNSVYRLQNQDQFMIEGIFQDTSQAYKYMEELEENKITVQKYYHIIKTLKIEEFILS